jgi:hypothetical protein
MSKTILIGLAVVGLASLVAWLALSPAREGPVAVELEPAGDAQPPNASGDRPEQSPFEAPSVAGLGVERPQPVPQDDGAAAARERQAAEQGDAGAQVALGDRYLTGKGVLMDEAEALRWYRAAADQGSSAGQVRIGLMYENGQGVAKDNYAAQEWYELAAAQGDPAAAANLGDLFEFGWYVNYKQAAFWYRQSANKGYAAAQADLGRLYESGRGVDQDYRQAYLWYSLAAARGDKTAARNRDLVSTRLSPAEIAEARKLALEWRPKQPKPLPTTGP